MSIIKDAVWREEKRWRDGYETAYRRILGVALSNLPDAVDWKVEERLETRKALEILYRDINDEPADWGEMHMADCVRQLEKAVHQLPLPTDESDDQT